MEAITALGSTAAPGKVVVINEAVVINNVVVIDLQETSPTPDYAKPRYAKHGFT
jgi:hypothetical protein